MLMGMMFEEMAVMAFFLLLPLWAAARFYRQGRRPIVDLLWWRLTIYVYGIETIVYVLALAHYLATRDASSAFMLFGFGAVLRVVGLWMEREPSSDLL
jgi:hypothetical protein